MKNFYFSVDKKLLSQFNSESQKFIQDFIDEYLTDNNTTLDNVRPYLIYCPYCNTIASVITGVHKQGNIEIFPYVCAFCGESAPYHKITFSIQKAQILYNLAIESKTENKKNGENEIQKVLLEQSIVVLATGIELYFKEIFVLCMELQYVKPNFSLFSKFNKDVRNDFLNTGKMVTKYKENLKLDMNDILGTFHLKKLTHLMLLRNVIVHNNGIADKIFLNNLPSEDKLKYAIGKPVPTSSEEILEYIQITNEILERIEIATDSVIQLGLEERLVKNYPIFKKH